jgi:Zn-dependent M28 family amino/carboxypeptidase
MATAEEQGLLGSFHYTHSSLFSPQRTVACINFDILNIFGQMRDISFYGSGQNELEDLAEMLAAKKQQRIVTVLHNNYSLLSSLSLSHCTLHLSEFSSSQLL